jgi:hypothetical protein
MAADIGIGFRDQFQTQPQRAIATVRVGGPEQRFGATR